MSQSKRLLSLLTLLIATLLPVYAYDFEVDGIYYDITSDTTAAVTYISNDRYNSVAYSGAVIIPSSVTYDGITYQITSIGYRAFYYCSELTSVTIPESVTSIGNYAFVQCDSLTSVTIPGSVTSIGDYAFEYCSSLTAITISEGVTSIGNYAFEQCHSLTSITIPGSVTSIGKGAFDYCSSLTAITISEGVTSIGDWAFSLCESLTSITIPESVTSIGKEAFSCCSSLTSVTIPESVTSIGDSAFDYCSSLTSVSLSGNMSIIPDSCFINCINLHTVNIKDGIKSIEKRAFEDCPGILELTLPESLNIISYDAFYECDYAYFLKKLTCLAIEPPKLTGDYNFFYKAPTIYRATLYVPAESYDLYLKSPSWNKFAKIEVIDTKDPDNPDNPDNTKTVSMKIMSPEFGAIEYQLPYNWDAKFSISPLSGWEVKYVLLNDVYLSPDDNCTYSTGNLTEDSILQIIYSQILTEITECKDNQDKIRIYCKDGELLIKNRPEDEMVSVYTSSGALIWSGFKDQVEIDEDIPMIIVKIGDYSYKLVVR